MPKLDVPDAMLPSLASEGTRRSLGGPPDNGRDEKPGVLPALRLILRWCPAADGGRGL